MRILPVSVLPFVLLLASCGAPRHSANVQRFFEEAKVRASTGATYNRVNLNGLRFTLGSLPNSRAKLKSNQDSILVSDTNTAIREAVEIVVTPAIGLALPDAGQPSPEFLDRLQRDTEKALQRNRYASVQLGTLPDPGEPDTTPLPARTEESIQVIDQQPLQGDRVLYATYGSEKDRRFVSDLIASLRPQLDANKIEVNTGPDAEAIRIVVNSDGRTWTLTSWHPVYERNSNVVVTHSGVSTLDGRSRAVVLAEEPVDYQNFRSLFDTLYFAMKSRR